MDLLGWGSALWNLFTGERNRNDSLNTQAKVFEREDTSLTRRMIDAKNAGINPLLVAGQSAQTSSPTIQKGGEIDPNDFMAPLQMKLLNTQIGVTEAEKSLKLLEVANTARENQLKADAGYFFGQDPVAKSLTQLPPLAPKALQKVKDNLPNFDPFGLSKIFTKQQSLRTKTTNLANNAKYQDKQKYKESIKKDLKTIKDRF